MLLVFCGERVLVVRRSERLLGGLFVFPDVLEESDPSALCARMEAQGLSVAYDGLLGHARHVFTHIIWEMEIHALLAERAADVPEGQWVTGEELERLPLPTAVKRARELAMARLRG